VDVTVRFQPSGRSLRVPRGTTLLDAVRGAGLPMASACGAQRLCGRCGLEILDAAAPLCAESEEERRAKQRNRADPRSRLACCVSLETDTVVRAPYW
jgi:ferredoxin